MRFLLALVALMAGTAGSLIWLMPDDRESGLAVVSEVETNGRARLEPSPSANTHNSGQTRFFGNGLATNQQSASVANVPESKSPAQAAPAWQTQVQLTPKAGSPIGSALVVTSNTGPAPREISRDVLIRDIQRELKRVGCYYGDADGDWGPGSRRAMTAFLQRVNSALPTEQPDLIQLTLVRGYSGAACRAGDASTITARSAPMPVEAIRPAPTSPVALRALPQAQPSPRPAPEARLATAPPAAQPQPGIAAQVPPPVIVFEGRMGVGGPRTPEAPDTASSLPLTAAAPVVPSTSRQARSRSQQQPRYIAQFPQQQAQRPRQSRQASRRWTATFFNQ